MNCEMTEPSESVNGARDEAGLNRRTILGGAAAGFALAANGLFLPEWLQETEAREGVNNGEMGGRRGKDHRGRDRDRRRHHRDRDQKPDRDPPKGIFDNEGVLNIQFNLINNNDAGTAPIDATCFSYQWDTLVAITWEDKTVLPESGRSFKTTVKKASLYIDESRHIVWAKNPFFGFPTIEITSAGGRSGAGPKNMDVGDTLSWQSGNYKIDVTRYGDTDDHKVFRVAYEN